MVINTLVLFYVYRKANQVLGLELIGLWSVVTTLTSFGNIGTFGIAGSLVKFTAEHQSTGDPDQIVKLLNSFFAIMFLLACGFLILLYVGALLFLEQIVGIKYIDKALHLLPFAFLVFLLTTLGSLVLSVIEGLNKAWQKNVVVISANIGMLLCSIFWIDMFGIEGIFYAQLVQAGLLFILGWVLVKINFKDYHWDVYTKDRLMLRKVLAYGFKFQSVSVLQMLGEPVTKFFLSRYGGLSWVGVFEMASRVVVQVRAILATVVSNLLPKIVQIYSTDPMIKTRNVYSQVFNVNFYLFAFAFGGLAIFSEVIVHFWLGVSNNNLVNLIQLLSLAWFINSLSIVPYVFNLGSGQMKGNVVSHGIVAATNIIGGWLLIVLDFVPQTFIALWILSLILGSVYTITEFGKRSDTPASLLISSGQVFLLVMILIPSAWIGLSGYLWMNSSVYILITAILVYIIIMLVYIKNTSAYLVVREYLATFINRLKA